MLLRMAGVIALSCVCGNAFAKYGFDPVSALAPDAVGAYAIAVGDVTGDDLDDVVVLGSGDHAFYRGKVLVYAQQAAGGFSAPVAHAFSEVPPNNQYQLALADLDADGDLDIVVSHELQFQYKLTLLLNDGELFTLATFPQDSPSSDIDFMDVDEDGHLDILTKSAWWPDQVYVHHGDGSGGIRDQAMYPVAANAYTWYLADMDNDGKRDLVYATYQGVFMQRHQDGGFWWEPRKLLAAGWLNMAVGDFNADGRTDIAIARETWGRHSVAVYMQQYGGYHRSQLLESESFPGRLLAHDMDDDGRDDLVMVRHDATIDVFFSRPGGFHPRASFVGDSASALAFGDFNQDGLADVAMAQSNVSLLISRGAPIENDLAVFMGLVPNAAALRVENRGALASQTYQLNFRIDARVGTIEFADIPEGCYDSSWNGDNEIVCTHLPPLAPGAYRLFAFPFTLSTGDSSNVLNALGEVSTDPDLRQDNNTATERLFIGTLAPPTTTRQHRR